MDQSKDTGSFIKRKGRLVLAILALAAYVGYAVSTFMENSFWIELFSPVMTILCVIVILACMKDMGKFRILAILLASGIGMWAVADIILFVNDIFLHMEEPQNTLVRTIYLAPNYLYGSTIILYLYYKLKKRDLLVTAANVFLITIISFAVVAKLVQAAGVLSENDPALIRAYAYFFVNIVIVVGGCHVIYYIGYGNLRRGTNLIPICIMGYILIDFRYSYIEAIGKDPENIYMDLLYMLFMVGMAWGTLSQAHNKYEYVLKENGEEGRRMIYVRLIIPILIVVVVVLRLTGVLSQAEFSYILIALLAYFIMYALLQNSGLSEKLLKQQQELNTSLEAQVEEKTQDLKRVNRDLEYLSSTDLLTGLFNRRHGLKVLNNLIYDSEKYQTKFAVFGIDLNHFKPVNDTYGHEMGDRVLEEFGKRMRDLPARYTCIRNGGDEFVIFFSHVNDRNDVEEAARELQNVFNKPLVIDNFIFSLSASIGIAIYPEDSINAEDLLQYADAAMYMVKRSKNRDDFRFFDNNMVTDVERRRNIEKQLKHSELEDDFLLYYQPQFDTADGSIVGVEVFPRLRVKGFEDCTPGELIPIAEESGMMSQLGMWTAHKSMEQVAAWNKKYGLNLSTTINLAPLQLLDADFIESLEKVIERLEIKPSDLILDVSNEVMMGAAESAKDTLRTFHQFGYTLSLNEFGGGDINISYIRDCGFSTIKLARTLIPQGITDPDRMEIIHALLALAKEMKVEIVAVGIETDEQVELMRNLGIRVMQGYYYSKPVSAEELEQRLKEK
ncbi:MAG: EAL domain-containing protein [Lachnospiraceae bacterium]|nr:EAL domain-containing protein [Lachnospiraceae bacterium]